VHRGEKPPTEQVVSGLVHDYGNSDYAVILQFGLIFSADAQ
jgi:hypothetical protein